MAKTRLEIEELSPKAVRKLLIKAVKRERFHVEDPTGDEDFRIRSGSLPLSIFAGAFVLYLNAAVWVDPADDGVVEVNIEWMSPWWTGLIGVARTRSAVKRVTRLLGDLTDDAGGEMYEV